MKKAIAWVLLLVLSMAFSSSAAFAMSIEEIEAAVEANEGKYEPGSPLTKDDFIVYSTDDSIENADPDSNVLDACSAYGVFGLFCFGFTPKNIELLGDEEPWETTYSYRGIILEDCETHTSLTDKESVLLKYGIGVEGAFDPNTDKTYMYYSGVGANEDGANEILSALEACDSFLLYSYKNEGQIKFCFDSTGTICCTLFLVGIPETADKETTQRIQEYLNEKGYDCGTPDGIAGKKTQAALAQFQEEHDLFPSGCIDDSLMKYIAGQE